MKNEKAKKYAVLLPKMAASNIRKNASTYFPYIGVSSFAMFTYFVFDLILRNDVMYTLPKGAYAVMLISIGFGLLGIIMVPFLYYTNSFLIKRRKRELGLYSILGLEKKHIGIMMFWESLAVYGIVMAAAIVMGLVFSRLIFLLLLNLAKLPVDVEFAVSPKAVTDTFAFYAFVTGLNLFVNLVQVGKANPVELMSGARRGEKEPRFIGIWSIVGALALGLGYEMAIRAELDSGIFTDFFLAVFLVIIGTYLLFTSGSIAVLRFMKRRKAFYYRSDNFIAVSGMLYRMKKSAASLSNICVFSTMVIITVACTVTVYLGMEAIVTSRFSREFEVEFFGSERVDEDVLKQAAAALAEQACVELRDELSYAYVKIQPFKEGNCFKTGDWDYNLANWPDVFLMTKEEYNRMEGTDVRLDSGEVLIFSDGLDFGWASVRFEEAEYVVKEELAACRAGRKVEYNALDITYVVVFADREQLARASGVFGVDGTKNISYFYGFQPVGEERQIDAFSRAMEQYASGQAGFAAYTDYREWERDQESMYGGLLFIGIFFGSIFLICLLIIMYYKQITEGFEDRKNFEVMQKVGMSDREIHLTIKKQVRMVFALPLAGALFHTAVGMRMVQVLLGAIGFYETALLACCTVACCTIFVIVYSLSYKRTSVAYYRIVK